jgi:hypothetical protein
MGEPDVRRLFWGWLVVVFMPALPVLAQNATPAPSQNQVSAQAQNPLSAQPQNPVVNELKGRIFDAEMTEKTFANGLKFCHELDGKNFYFEPRNRVLNLEDYHRSVENLAREHVFNPEARRPWNEEDAEARWKQVQNEALKDKANCEMISNLPQLHKQLEDLQKQQSSAH